MGGYHMDSINYYYWRSDSSVSVLEHINNINDLGVTFDSGLKFDLHINEKRLINFTLSWVLFTGTSSICYVILNLSKIAPGIH